MGERKPPGVSWESWTEHLVRRGLEEGELDAPSLHGKPIPSIDQPRDENWWLRRKLRQENVQFEVPQLAIRDERARVLAAIEALDDEGEVRAELEALNERIRHVNRTVVSGPPTTVTVLDVDALLTDWRDRHRHAH